jgi:hypothetical protein
MTPSATLAFHGTRLRTLYAAGAVALSLTLAVLQPRPAAADHKHNIVVPAVPANLQVPAGNKVYLEGHGVGTQNYICLPCPNPINTATCPASGFIWTLFAPQATLFDVDDGDDDQIITHFLSTNPADGKARPTWQHSRDTSAVWGNAIASATSTTDPDFVAAGAIPWLKLEVVGSQTGPDGGHKLTGTTFIQRLDTSGGVAPAATACDEATEVGTRVLVPYGADYFFYQADQKNQHNHGD